MASTILILLVLLFTMCFSIYNWWFQREKYKRLLDEERKRLSPFNSPGAWGIYSIISLLAILSIIGYNMYIIMNGIMELKNTVK